MDFVRRIDDGSNARIGVVEYLQIQSENPEIACLSCGGKAGFKKASRNGHKAHFAAKHEEGCNEKSTQDRKKRLEWANEEDEERLSSVDDPVLVFRFGESIRLPTKHKNTQRKSERDAARRFTKPGDGTTSERKRVRFRAVLIRLLDGESFRFSDGKTDYDNALECFVDLRGADVSAGEGYFFGTTSTSEKSAMTRGDKQYIFVASRRETSPKLAMAVADLDELASMSGLSTEDLKNGVAFLVKGKLWAPKRNPERLNLDCKKGSAFFMRK